MKTYTVTLMERKWLSSSAFEVALDYPESFQFRAGQNIRFIHQGRHRHYCPVSAPDENPLVLCVSYLENGWFSNILAESRIGSEFIVSGPHGYFMFSPSSRQPVFIATCTGIAPFVSMVRDGVRDFILFHGVRHEKDLFYRELLLEASERYVPRIWGVDRLQPSARRLFQDAMEKTLPAGQDNATFDFYLCGWEKMIKDVMDMIDERYPGSLVYNEIFYT